MSNATFILIVTYMGLCLGTFITLKDSCSNCLKAIMISVVSPIPILFTLMWAATTIAFNSQNSKTEQHSYFWLLFLSFTMYSDAVALLSTTSVHSSNNSRKFIYGHKAKTFPYRVRSRIASSITATA